jgi:hypothetical protein
MHPFFLSFYKQLVLSFVFLLALQQVAAQQTVPESVRGNWLKTDGSNEWVLGLYAGHAVYKNQFWEATDIREKSANQFSVQLRNASQQVTVHVKTEDNTVWIKEGAGKTIALRKTRTVNTRYKHRDKSFRMPLLRRGTVHLKGVFLGFRSYTNFRGEKKESHHEPFVMIAVPDEYNGTRRYYSAGMDTHGRFDVAFPVTHAVWVTIQSGDNRRQVFVEPDDDLLVAIDNSLDISAKNKNLEQVPQQFSTMGSNAAFNNDYHLYRAMVDKQPWEDYLSTYELSKWQLFGTYYEMRTTALKKLNEFCQTHHSCPKFKVFEEASLNYGIASKVTRDLNGTFRKERLQRDDLKEVMQEFSLIHPLARILPAYADYANALLSVIRYNWYNGSGLEEIQPTARAVADVEKGRLVLAEKEKSLFLSIYKDRNWRVIDSLHRADAVYTQQVSERFNQIINSYHALCDDQRQYEIAKREIPASEARFQASLRHLIANSIEEQSPRSRIDSARLAMFQQYHAEADKLDLELLVEANNRFGQRLAQLEPAAGTRRAFGEKSRERIPPYFTYTDKDETFEELIKSFGKTVFIQSYSHYYQSEHVHARLILNQRLLEHFKGQNFVLLNMVRNTSKSERDQWFTAYALAFDSYGQLQNSYAFDAEQVKLYFDQYYSQNDVPNIIVFDKNGQLHRSQAESNETNIIREIEKVMRGEGNFVHRPVEGFLYGEWYLAPHPATKTSLILSRQPVAGTATNKIRFLENGKIETTIQSDEVLQKLNAFTRWRYIQSKRRVLVYNPETALNGKRSDASKAYKISPLDRESILLQEEK